MRNLLLIVVVLCGVNLRAQELNVQVVINAEQVQNSNQQVFLNLQQSISDFLNNTKWTSTNYKPQEKINCTFTLNILESPSTNEYKGSIQVQASRPVYNSSYQTSLLNYKDDQLSFTYTEFETLRFNETSFESNLVSILTFYVYTILGLDGDSFALKGGEVYHKKAENVVNLAQQGGYAGWNRIDGNATRYQLNENLLSPSFEDFRTLFYEYHLKGLDLMATDIRESKKQIAKALNRLQNVYNRRANAYLLRVFIDAKGDELVEIFSDGPRINEDVKLKEMLLKMYPTFREKWDKI
ncbi:DUF4835 family protein [Flavobacteriaceae bacterium F08102]|nr:DUF4835 family protein [Flavobacteriaceae bacterium F08102]